MSGTDTAARLSPSSIIVLNHISSHLLIPLSDSSLICTVLAQWLTPHFGHYNRYYILHFYISNYTVISNSFPTSTKQFLDATSSTFGNTFISMEQHSTRSINDQVFWCNNNWHCCANSSCVRPPNSSRCPQQLSEMLELHRCWIWVLVQWFTHFSFSRRKSNQSLNVSWRITNRCCQITHKLVHKTFAVNLQFTSDISYPTCWSGKINVYSCQGVLSETPHCTNCLLYIH